TFWFLDSSNLEFRTSLLNFEITVEIREYRSICNKIMVLWHNTGENKKFVLGDISKKTVFNVFTIVYT
ncbi:MAG: hypothetical protein ACI90V_009458, partial [Bacillariaceae sp.]